MKCEKSKGDRLWEENRKNVNNVAEKYILMGFVLIAEQKIRKMKYWQ